MSLVEVVAGLIIHDGRVLLTQRRADQDFPFAWESPGGKVQSGEAPDLAVARELHEELGVERVVTDPLPLFRAEFRNIVKRPDRAHVAWSLYLVRSYVGPPRALEQQGLGWFMIHELEELAFTPGNRAALGFIVEAVHAAVVPEST